MADDYFCVLGRYNAGVSGWECCDSYFQSRFLCSAGVLNRCAWMQSSFPLRARRDVVALKTSPCFVDSVWELFGPLLAGATITVIAQVRQPAQSCIADRPARRLPLLTPRSVQLDACGGVANGSTGSETRDAAGRIWLLH